jgi:hypothetical protein
MAAILNRKNWDSEECAYIVRLTESTRRAAFWCTGMGQRAIWVVAIWDNEGNQIGEADFYANKRCFPTYI